MRGKFKIDILTSNQLGLRQAFAIFLKYENIIHRMLENAIASQNGEANTVGFIPMHVYLGHEMSPISYHGY